jgi:predicted transporter
LLDERQIAARNAAYLVAYRWLALVALVVVMLLIAAADGKLLAWDYRDVLKGDLHRLAITFLLFMAILPASVLAWQLPSEPHEESEEPQQVT